MLAIIDFIGSIFKKIYDILDVQLFPDFPVTYIQLLLISFVIVFIIKFIFGGMKEFNNLSTHFGNMNYTKMANTSRIKQLQKQYKHSKNGSYPILFDYNWLEDEE